MNEIVIGPDEKRVVNEAIAALAMCDGVYQRGGNLVHVVTADAPQIRVMAIPTLQETLASAALWLKNKQTREGWEREPCHPPSWAVGAVAARGEWDNVPKLRAVTETPVLRPDGSILQKEGYDPTTSLLYRPSCKYPVVPADPTKEQALNAVAALLDVVTDFPFSTPAHKSAWLAGALTPFARHAFLGPAPLFLVDANTRGTGKGLAIDAATLIYSAHGIAHFTQAPDEAAENKRIVSIALHGHPIVLIDNISRPLGNGVLDSALTAIEWCERILGGQEMPTLPLTATWWASGNNVQFKTGGDTARRTLHIRLESPDEKPEERTGFRHTDLLAHVRAHRQDLVAAALTLLRAYYAAGRPTMNLKSWGSFERWSDLVRGAIVWAGLDDPFTTHTGLVEAADADAAGLWALIEAWEAFCRREGEAGCTAADAVRALEEDREAKSTRYQGLRDALAELVNVRPGSLPNAREIGYLLRRYKGRVLDGRMLFPIGAKSNKGQQWGVTMAGGK